jgi:hypothetical protein
VTLLKTLLKPLFEVSPKDIPAFAEDTPTTRRLKQVVFTVTDCCHLTFVNSRFDVLVPRLDDYEDELRGFAYEGAGTGLAALDCFLPWKNRTRDFINGPGSHYTYAVLLGAGMGLARIKRRPEPFIARLDNVFGWVVMDGYGFHEGFFAYRRTVDQQVVPASLSIYARRVFDQGLGRSIWFSSGAIVDRVVATISSFPLERQIDLWSGVGLACGYTGGVDRPTVEILRSAVGPYRSQLALGVVIAARARQHVSNPVPHNEMACEILCGLSSEEAAHLANDALQDLPTDSAEPAYEIWRQRVKIQLAIRAEGTCQYKESKS